MNRDTGVKSALDSAAFPGILACCSNQKNKDHENAASMVMHG
jgi:hypothetical protein